MKNTLILFVKNKYGIVSKIATYPKEKALNLAKDNDYKNAIAKTMNTTPDRVNICIEWYMNNQTGELLTFSEALKEATLTNNTINNYTKIYK